MVIVQVRKCYNDLYKGNVLPKAGNKRESILVPSDRCDKMYITKNTN